MGQRKSVSNDRDWWLGAWDWAAMVENNTRCKVQVSLKPSAQRGTWGVEVRLVAFLENGGPTVVARTSGGWPNAQQNDLGAYVMNLTIGMDKDIGEEAEGLLRDLA